MITPLQQPENLLTPPKRGLGNSPMYFSLDSEMQEMKRCIHCKVSKSTIGLFCSHACAAAYGYKEQIDVWREQQ
jgi:hypothetical protein